MKLFISFIILFCSSLFLFNECDGLNNTYGLKKKWYFNDEEDYDENYHNIYASSSNYIGMKINPYPKNILKAPILLVAEKPIDNVIVTKVLPHMAKPIKNKLYNGVSYKNLRNPYNTLPGTYTKRSYAGEIINYGKKYDRPQDLYRTYLSSNSYQIYNQYCTKSYGQKKTISKKDLDQAFAYALAEVKGYKNREKRMEFQGGFMNVSGPYSSTARHQISTYLNQQDSEGTEEKEAFLMEFASKFLNKYKCLNKYDTHFILPNLKIYQRPMKNSKCNFSYSQDGAQNSIDCREFVDSKFRSPDGSCNNIKHPFWGKSSVCHIRLVASAYEDGVSEPRQNSFKYGRKLPTARHVSQAAHYEKPDRFFYTLMVMAFGQFLNHDITFTPQTKLESKDSIIDCCKKVPGNKKDKVHPQCLPILLPSNDYQTIVHKKTCMNFVRSAPCPLCNLGPREQVNQVTSFIDLSTVYGSDGEEQKKLRTFKGGILKFSRNRFGNIILPKSESQDQCSSKLNSQFCFVAGDVRVNQQPILQAYHLLYLRSHNIFATNLAKVNPNWSDERLFQEARRLNIAIYQHITYEEYLPLIFGPTLNSFYNINSDGYDTYSKYDYNSKSQHYKKNLYTIYEPKTDPTTWNDYATAACRYGHSLISSFYNLIGGSGYNGSNYTLPHGSNKPGYWLRDVFFSSSLLHEGQLDAILKGLSIDKSMLMDPFFSNDIKNFLYKSKDENVGSDLIAVNIQRGRDHGIPPYHVYVNYCFGEKIKDWSDLAKFIPVESIGILQRIYADVRDIDFFTGGMYEKKFPDASLGPTFSCVLGIQYYHLKFGDRYFYSHGYQAGSFTPDQLLNIKETASLAYFLCLTSDNIQSIQLNPFLPASKSNYEVPCKNFNSINFDLFKE